MGEIPNQLQSDTTLKSSFALGARTHIHASAASDPRVQAIIILVLVDLKTHFFGRRIHCVEPRCIFIWLMEWWKFWQTRQHRNNALAALLIYAFWARCTPTRVSVFRRRLIMQTGSLMHVKGENNPSVTLQMTMT